MIILRELVQLNFLPICIVIFLFIFMHYNVKVTYYLVRLFRVSLIILFLLILDDNLDYQFAKTGMSTTVHVITAVLGYMLRLTLMYSFIIIIQRGTTRKERLLLLIPWFVCLVVEGSAFFTPVVFYYKSDNTLVRSWLSYTPHIMFLVYTVVLGVVAVKRLRTYKKVEGVILIVSLAVVMIAVALETVFALRGILIDIIALCLISYYLYLHMEYFKLDSLTGIGNRVSFYEDLSSIDDASITGVMSIDLNDLKKINDTKGHAEGDKLLKGMVDIIRPILRQFNCYFYRTGGDEFVILCINMSYDAMMSMYNILDEKRNGEISWSMGLSIRKTLTIDECLKQSDAFMYNDKRKHKVVRFESITGGNNAI